MKLRIGTRKSRLALAQTELVADAIRQAFPDAGIVIVPITTKGDRIIDRPLAQIGGRGVFIAEIEAALRSNVIDLAVHSAKDLPISLAEGTCISAVLKRANPSDVLVTRQGDSLSPACIFGTSSHRRALAIQKLYPEATIRDLRGNVDTRLQKLLDREYDAILLAAAGLARLGFAEDARFSFQYMTTQQLVPAACQGIIAVQSRRDSFSNVLQTINDADTFTCFETERYVLQLLDAGCSAPIGVFSELKDGMLHITVTCDQRNIISGVALPSERFALAERLVKQL